MAIAGLENLKLIDFHETEGFRMLRENAQFGCWKLANGRLSGLITPNFVTHSLSPKSALVT